MIGFEYARSLHGQLTRCSNVAGDDRRGRLNGYPASADKHAQGEDRDPGRGSRFTVFRWAQQPSYTCEEGPIGRSHGQGGVAAPPASELHQRCRVRRRLATHRHRRVVATVFPFLADARRNPPCAWMVEQEGFCNALQEIHGVVAATDVRQFVGKNGFDLSRRQVVQRRNREEDDRANPADDGRRIDKSRFHHTKSAVHTQPRRKPLARRLPGRHRIRQGSDSYPVHAPTPPRESRQEQRHASKPSPHGEGQPRIDGRHGFSGDVVGRRHLHRPSSQRRVGDVETGIGREYRSSWHERGTARRHERGGRDWRSDHGGQAGAGDRVPYLRRASAAQVQCCRRCKRDQSALPDEMNKRPAGYLRPWVHRRPPRCLSTSFRISASSAGDVFAAARACITSFDADPSKTLSSRSITSCR